MTNLLSFGLPAAIQRIGMNTSNKSYYSNILVYKLVVGILVILIILPLCYFLNFQVWWVHTCLAVLIGFLQSNLLIIENKFIAEESSLKHRSYTFLRFLIITLLIATYVALIEGGVTEIVVIQLVVLTLYNIHLILRLKVSEIKKIKEEKQSIAFGLHSLPFGLALWGLNMADRLVLESFVDLEALSIYSVGYQIASIIIVVAMGIRDAWRPKLYKTLENEHKHYTNSKVFIYYSWIIFLLCSGIPLISQFIFDSFESLSQYTNSLRITSIVVIGMYFQSLSIALIGLLLYQNSAKLISQISIIIFLINLGLNIVFVPKYGIYACAYITIITYLLQFTITGIFVKRVFHNIYMNVFYLGVTIQSILFILTLKLITNS
ncbi:O-antigen/teichoic acid export membrane protein [Marinoscillum furvescens DSM 4134]|uniref:O-antigen/teichoic acid export membrane protein n=2 Tax=Marinoscillum furvescens TaxID=1026 RepID=A0A3D9L1P8_MARFU|nr:O-antigen/teichoic acid export membrane protein [Marinoscillum furvescens DSM 4134]